MGIALREQNPETERGDSSTDSSLVCPNGRRNHMCSCSQPHAKHREIQNPYVTFEPTNTPSMRHDSVASVSAPDQQPFFDRFVSLSQWSGVITLGPRSSSSAQSAFQHSDLRPRPISMVPGCRTTQKPAYDPCQGSPHFPEIGRFLRSFRFSQWG